jgi:hypothetical protein
MAHDLKGGLGILVVGQCTECHQTNGEYRHKKPFCHCHFS